MKQDRDIAFELYHRDNPRVYDELVKLARELREHGRRHYGMKSLFEVLRFHSALSARGDEFKLNNNYTSRYARLIMAREYDLRDFFTTRELLP